ncbi:MAG: hypothetical protein ACPG7F_02890 [Aggregatilineales bacterium]
MGLGAFVYCNCYKEGRTKPFPLPDLEQYFYIDANSYMSLRLDWDKYRDEYRRVDLWIQNACEHENMHYVSKHIGRWRFYSSLKETLAMMDWNNFPTLQAELLSHVELINNPKSFTTADKATKMLEELVLFRRIYRPEVPVAIETKTGEVICEGDPLKQGKGWFFITNVGLALDRQGIFIEADGIEKFRSMRLHQKVLAYWYDDVSGTPRQVEFRDLDTQQRFIWEHALSKEKVESGKMTVSYPESVHLEYRILDTSKYESMLEALETVCKASVETGNPVVWC